MKKLLSLMTMTLMMLSVNLHAGDITAHAGEKGNSYHRHALEMNKLIGVPQSSIRNHAGGAGALKAVNDNHDGYGFAQVDSWMVFNEENPGHQLMMLGTLPGRECVFTIVSSESGINDEDDMGKEGITLNMGKLGSGATDTLKYFAILDGDFGKIKIDYISPTISLGMIQSNSGGVDGFMFVAKPDYDNKYFDIVRKSDGTLKFAPWDDMSLNNKLPSGESVYEFETIVTDDRGWDTKVETPCVKTGVFVNKNMDESMMGRISSALLTNAANFK